MDAAILREAHRYWFGPLKTPTDQVEGGVDKWFRGGEAVDAEIREKFGAAIAPAAAADWDFGRLTREEQVGLVIMLDQFPRNIFRVSAEAFAYDPAARRYARMCLEEGVERFFLVERGFLLLPFEHSEDVADQDLSVALAADLAISAPPDQKEGYRMMLDYATRHRDVIRRFGRFPHRNEALGRASTEEEIAFMKEHGRGF